MLSVLLLRAHIFNLCIFTIVPINYLIRWLSEISNIKGRKIVSVLCRTVALWQKHDGNIVQDRNVDGVSKIDTGGAGNNNDKALILDRVSQLLTLSNMWHYVVTIGVICKLSCWLLPFLFRWYMWYVWSCDIPECSMTVSLNDKGKFLTLGLR